MVKEENKRDYEDTLNKRIARFSELENQAKSKEDINAYKMAKVAFKEALFVYNILELGVHSTDDDNLEGTLNLLLESTED